MAQRKMIVFALLAITAMLSAVVGSIQAQDFGVNWSATFFPTNNLTGTGVPVTGINGVNFNWGQGAPIVNGVAVPGIPVDNFSARFVSSQNFNAGVYTFTVSSDDGVRIFIDGAVVLDKFVNRSLTTDTFQHTFTAGSHNLTVEYFDANNDAIIQVQWGTTGGVAPTAAGPTATAGPTFTPAPTGLPIIPSGALTATIIRAPVLNIRSAPSALSDRIGQVRRGQTYAVIGRDARARWFLLQLSDKVGWASGYYLFINGNEFNAPVVSNFVLEGNPSAASGVVAQSSATVKLRALPTVYSEQIGRITWGGAVGVVGRTRGGDWWQVVWKGTTGWVASGFFDIIEGNLDSVPIIDG